jgi:hypothetical protein
MYLILLKILCKNIFFIILYLPFFLIKAIFDINSLFIRFWAFLPRNYFCISTIRQYIPRPAPCWVLISICLSNLSPKRCINCYQVHCLPQYWHMPSSRSRMALISFFGIGFLPDVRLWVGLGIMRTPSPFRTVPSDFRLAADSAFQTTVQ